jgi:hypothetical protein
MRNKISALGVKNLIKHLISKIGNWLLISIWFALGIWIIGIIYAYTWTAQPNVWAGSWLTSSSWNAMLDNIRYLKDNVDNKISSQWITSWNDIYYSWGNVWIWMWPTTQKVDVNGNIHSKGISTDTEIWGQWALQMLATSSCVAKSWVWWVAAYQRWSSTSCNSKCANTGSIYYKNCRWMISVRWYNENAGVNAVDWFSSTGCSETWYVNYQEFWCCCSY